MALITAARRARRVAVASACAIALGGCAALFDFGDYDTSRPGQGDAATSSVEPFVIRVVPASFSGRSGDRVPLRVTVERRIPFDAPITIGLAEAKDVSLEVQAPSGPPDTIEAQLLLGRQHGAQSAVVTATSGAYPGFSASAPITIAIRGLPGTLDTTFGTSGVFETEALITAADVAALDDRILVVGTTALAGGEPSGSLAMVRVLENGTIDGSFGAGGVAIALAGSGGIGAVGAGCVAVTADGGAFVAGTPAGSQTSIALVDSEGRLVTSFGTAGFVRSSDRACKSLQVLADGRILMVDELGVVRHLSTGKPDPSFGDGGRAELDGSLLGGAIVNGSQLLVTGTLNLSSGNLITFDMTDDGRSDSGRRYPIPFGGQCDPVRPVRLGDGRPLVGGSCKGIAGEGKLPVGWAIVAVGDADAGFGDAGLLLSDDIEALVTTAVTDGGFAGVTQRSLGSGQMVVTGHDRTGAATWTFDSNSSPLAGLKGSAAMSDRAGRVVVVGTRLVGGKPRVFVARFWT